MLIGELFDHFNIHRKYLLSFKIPDNYSTSLMMDQLIVVQHPDYENSSKNKNKNETGRRTVIT